MSYRNPGNLFVGDPNAFLKSFLTGIEKHRLYYEQQAKKEEDEQKQLDYSLAQFNKNMDYPNIAKTFSKDVANMTKESINKMYVDNGMFANANQQQRQDIYDEIGMNILNPLQKMGSAVKLDPTEIDLFSLDEGVFKDFLKNKVNGFEIIMGDNGVPAISFNTEKGKKTLNFDDIPDKIDLLKNKGDILDGFDAKIKENINSIDYSYRQAEDPLKIADKLGGDIQSAARKIFSEMDDQTKNVIFNKYGMEAIDMSMRYNDFPENATEEEKEELLQQQEGAILEYITFQLRNGSATANRVDMRLEEEQNPLSGMNAEQRKKYLEGQENIATINKIYDRINQPDALKGILEFDLTVGTDPVTIENGVVKVPDLLTIDDEIVPAEFDLKTSLGRYQLASYMLEREFGADRTRLQEVRNILRDVFADERNKEIEEMRANQPTQIPDQNQLNELDELDRINLNDAQSELQQNEEVLLKLNDYMNKNINKKKGQYAIRLDREGVLELASFLPEEVIDPNLSKKLLSVSKLIRYKDKLEKRNKDLSEVVTKRQRPDEEIVNRISEIQTEIVNIKRITEDNKDFRNNQFYEYKGESTRGFDLEKMARKLEKELEELQVIQTNRSIRGGMDVDQTFAQ